MPDPSTMLRAGPRRIVVLAPNWLGDAVMALPAIADLRRRYPSAHVAVAARASVADLFRLTRHVDEVVTVQRRNPDALAAVRADVALLLPNSFGSAWLAWRAGIPERWGYASDMRAVLLTRAVARPRRSLHQGAYYQHLTNALGIESGLLQPELSVPDSAVAAARTLLSDRGWRDGSPVVALAPGAAYGTAKRWIPAYVAQLVADLVTRGATCVLVGGSGDRSTTGIITSSLVPAVAARVIDLTGETTLELLAGVLALANACVSNDSGAMHMAGAVGTPLVAVFGPTREYETAPLTRAGGRSEVLTHPVWCRPCMLRECPIDHRCMKRITPDRVLASVERLMTA